jgi:hypothetical protein
MAVSDWTFDVNHPVMRLHDTLSNRKSETRPLSAIGSGFV